MSSELCFATSVSATNVHNNLSKKSYHFSSLSYFFIVLNSSFLCLFSQLYSFSHQFNTFLWVKKSASPLTP